MQEFYFLKNRPLNPWAWKSSLSTSTTKKKSWLNFSRPKYGYVRQQCTQKVNLNFFVNLISIGLSTVSWVFLLLKCNLFVKLWCHYSGNRYKRLDIFAKLSVLMPWICQVSNGSLEVKLMKFKVLPLGFHYPISI